MQNHDIYFCDNFHVVTSNCHVILVIIFTLCDDVILSLGNNVLPSYFIVLVYADFRD